MACEEIRDTRSLGGLDLLVRGTIFQTRMDRYDREHPQLSKIVREAINERKARGDAPPPGSAA
jgi:hypothetical protein